jgi:hypothetical protein
MWGVGLAVRRYVERTQSGPVWTGQTCPVANCLILQQREEIQKRQLYRRYRGCQTISSHTDIIPNARDTLEDTAVEGKTRLWNAELELTSKFNQTANVRVKLTLRRVRTTTVAVEKHVFWMCVCSLRYTACNAHAPYCHLWPARFNNFFPHYLINGTIFEKKLLNTKSVFWFSVQLLSETFLILRRTERDMITNVYRSSCKVPVIVVRFWWNFEFSRQTFGKYLTIKFNKNPTIGNRLVPCGRTDGHYEANSRFPQFCKRA